MHIAGTKVRWRGTPARRRTFVALAAALVLSSPFMARAEASDGSSGAAADEPTATSLAPAEAAASTSTAGNDSPCVTTLPTSAPSDGASPSTTADAAANDTPASTPTCNGEADAGGTPRSAHDDCDDTGGSPTGAPRACPALPQGSPDGPDDRLADCAGDIFQQSCADLARALDVQCASAWSAWCLSTAPNMLMICADGDQWAAAPCERAKPVLVRYCVEVPGADPDRCPAIRPADGGSTDATDTGGVPGSAAGPRPTGGSTLANPGSADGPGGGPGEAGDPIGGPGSGPVDRQVDAPLSPQGTPQPKVVKKNSPAVGAASVEAKADPLAVGGTIPPELGVAAVVDAGNNGAGGGPTASPGDDGPIVETFSPQRDVASLGGAAAVRQAGHGLEPRPAASAQRAHDRWSLLSLGGALLLVMLTSAYDLRGRRRW